MKDVKVSEFLYFQPVSAAQDTVIGWNRFFPTIFILNRFARELLEALRNKETVPMDEETEGFFNELRKYKFIYDTGKDPSEGDFIGMIEQSLSELKKKQEMIFTGSKKPTT